MSIATYFDTVARDYRDYRRAEAFADAMVEFIRRLVQDDEDPVEDHQQEEPDE